VGLDRVVDEDGVDALVEVADAEQASPGPQIRCGRRDTVESRSWFAASTISSDWAFVRE
jgi:hypothetical protein